MRIVVTGALGHIGSRLIRDLPAVFQEAEIILLDNLATQRYCSLFNLPTHGKYRFLEADMMTCDLDSIFTGADVVIHLAALTNAPESFRMQEQVERINVEGTERVAQACLARECALIFASTTSVYGKSSGRVAEDCPPSDLKPQSPYADSKLKAERCLQREGEREGLHFMICRFGTVFGASPGMRFHTAVNKFCWQAALGQPISVWRTALDQLRPYLELGDAVRAVEFIMRENLFDGRIYNVLTTHATVRHLLEILSNLIPDLSVEYGEGEGMNEISCEVSNERFRSLGFEFHGELKRGIAEIVDLLRFAYQPNAFSSGIPTKS